ncbi:unnamed protein product [Clonostachys rosea]|uniref:Uncharacterized protein n=1 Tax=Bionectria ochroleuca TaxID=29856 RepID=A0ABY6TYR3_BIOOC|nr:unnamed protein product [Clonostachys rosea]
MPLVPPPQDYPTRCQLPLPAEFELSRAYLNQAGGIISNNLVTLYNMSTKFWDLSHYYYTVTESRFKAVSLAAVETNVQLNLTNDSEPMSLAQVQAEIDKSLDGVYDVLEQLSEQGGPYHGKSLPDLGSVLPNISLRECRLWCILNTRAFHRKLIQADGEKKKLAPIMVEIADLIYAQHVVGITPHLLKTKRATGMTTPYMIFVCIGQMESGRTAHPLVHVGTTREDMTQWKELYELRQKARDHRLGTPTIGAWKAWHRKLLALDHEAGARNEGDRQRTDINNARTALVLGDTRALSESGQQMLADKLRACSTHLGQSFRQREWGLVEGYPCCYVCKTSQAWNEIEDPNLSEAYKIDLEQRHECPHSCAEVATSGYCDFITRQIE